MAIHASQTFSSSETAELERILGHELDPALFTRAAFVAVADLAGVVKADSVEPSPWLCGPYAWLLKTVRPLPVPVPATGRLGLWRLAHDQLRAIELSVAAHPSYR